MHQEKVIPGHQEIEQRLMKVEQEHALLNARVDELARKEVMTPEEEIELKRLRKIKLFKKDMIAYLRRMLKGSRER